MKGTLRNPKRVLSKALKFTGKDENREILMCVHLDERGDVAACDSYRLFTAAGWSGPSINVPADLARKMTKIPAKYAEVEVEQVGNVIECRYGGNVLKGDAVEGEYPKYRQLMNGWEARAVSEIPAKQAAAICRAHKGEGVFVEVGDGSTVVWGAGCDTEPSAMFRTGCQGEGRVKLNAEYLESALKACGERACVKVMNESKPVLVAWGGMSVMLMPIMAGSFTEPLIKKLASKREEPSMAKKAWNMDSCEHFGSVLDGKKVHCKKHGIWTNCLEVGHCTLDKEEQVKETKSEEKDMAINLENEKVCITGTLPGMTRSEAFIRLKAVGGEPCERFTKKVSLFVIAAAAGRDKRKKADKAIADGQELRVVSGHEFVEALKAAEAEQTAKAIEQAAKRRKAKVEAKVTEHADVTAIEMTPKKEDSMIDEMKKQLEEMQAELKAARKELDAVWKENAQLKAKKQEPKSVPPAPKAPKDKDTAAVVSLETMQKWCEGKGLKAKQTNETASIWVLGPSKEYKDELIEMGARWGTSKKYGKGWYIAPSAA